MRIGMILDAAFPPDPRVEKEALSLIEHGHEVFLFSLNYTHKSSFEIYKGIKVSRFPAGKMVYKLSAISYPYPFYRWLVTPLIKKFIASNSIEIVHIHDMVIADAAIRASGKLPVVMDFHENRPEIMRDYKHVRSLSGRLLINIEVWKKKYYELAARANHVVVVTDLAKEDLLSKSAKKSDEITIVPNTIMKSEFLNYPLALSIKERMSGSFNILYIGDTSVRRGTRTAIEAISVLSKFIPDVKLWIVGSSSADLELRTLVETLKLSGHVQFEGWQNYDKLPSYIAHCHVAISPLLRNVHHDSTYANKIFQYMALGKPLVVSDSIAQAKLIENENCGLVHVAGNADSLAECIRKLYDNPAKAHELGENGKKAVLNKWYWENTIQPLIATYYRIQKNITTN